jgi:lipoprotein-releasing system ATP-binding protein
MIQAIGIHKHYGELQVLNGIDLEIHKGEIVSIVGDSGAGKTTLLHVLGTLDRPDTGKVIIDNHSVFDMGEKELAQFRNQHIGFVFQFHHLLPEFTALENICMPAWIMGSDTRQTRQKAEDMMHMLGVYERKGHKPGQLSGGEQQRVAVARALMNDPLVIFADEPSGNLDSKHAEALHHMFFQLRTQLNQTFVIVTHNQELAALSDRTITMKDGALK